MKSKRHFPSSHPILLEIKKEVIRKKIILFLQLQEERSFLHLLSKITLAKIRNRLTLSGLSLAKETTDFRR